MAEEALEVCAIAGLELDDWQEAVLRASLGERKKGQWAAFEVGVNVARQNGKGSIIEARILAELFVVKSPLTIYSAHNFDTALEHFRRVQILVEDNPRLSKEIIGRKGARRYGVTFGHGAEGLELTGNRRLRFRTRTKGGGRGFACDLLFLDEAMFLSQFTHGALLPIISARPNPQVWYCGSAVDQETHEDGVVFSGVRERGIKGDDPALAYFEWSAGNGNPEKDHPNAVFESAATDRAAWAQANPALGIRISPDVVAAEQRSMTPRTFAVERLGVGDWPRADQLANNPIRLEDWNALRDPSSSMEDPLDALAFDVSPDRRGSIAAVGANLQELWHLEIIDNRAGTSWLPTRVAELVERHRPRVVVCAGHSPATAFIQDLSDLGVDVQELSIDEHAQACGRLVDAVEEKRIRHPGGSVLAGAIRGAKSRPLGDAWLWSRRHSDVDISPLVAVTLALSAAIEGREASVYDTRGVLAV